MATQREILRKREVIVHKTMCADADVICCETVINPLEMFPYMTSAATTGADDDDDIKFLFTIRYIHTLTHSNVGLTWHAGALRRDATYGVFTRGDRRRDRSRDRSP